MPAGWLPMGHPASLKPFVAAATEVQQRRDTPGPLALVGQWDDQVTRMVERSLSILQDPGGTRKLPVFWWTADRLVRRDLLAALRIGLGAVIYFGHGRPYGWAGYHGLHSRHLGHAQGRPSGAVLSLTCHTASRRKVGTSFAESLVLAGIAAAALGAVAATQTIDNWWWGASLCEELNLQRSTTLGELLLRACPPRSLAVEAYRILGDPLAALRGTCQAQQEGVRVWAPSAQDSPVPPGYEEALASMAST
ncbi:MAG: hypothetical protein IPP58_04060 [Holophagaceae bacterium]|uniref:Gingipain domain-containing protein n=1 Tax=Candidatus Geothrix skivensis TaxID=2954439 RepID=A0A9D7SFB4_9BACT|nr:hypothetical protein [Candidatus Geothrix skivensis]